MRERDEVERQGEMAYQRNEEVWRIAYRGQYVAISVDGEVISFNKDRSELERNIKFYTEHLVDVPEVLCIRKVE